MAENLILKIVTPEGISWEGKVSSVTIPGVNGEIGVMPGHIPLSTRICAGELAVQQEGKNLFLAIGDGFVQINRNYITVLTDMAIEADNIDDAQIELARQRAEARLTQKLSAEELAAAQVALAQSVALLKVKKTRSRSH